MSKKEILTNVSIEGNKLVCPICNGKQFWTKKTLMNTPGMSFLNLDWANKRATNYICTQCGYVYWFMK